MLGTVWVADLVQRINQGVLVMRHEDNIEVDGGASGRETKRLPIWRDIIPGMLDTYTIPRRCERVGEVAERRGNYDTEDGEQAVPHDCWV